MSRFARALLLGVLLPCLAAVTPLPSPSHAVAPGINGRLLFVADYDSRNHSDIYSMDGNGSDRANLTGEDKSYIAYAPKASPDGTRIAFTRTVSGSAWTHIFVMDADGTDKRQLTTEAQGGGQSPTWSPDGQQILFVRSQGLWVMNADGSDQHLIRASDGWALSGPEWSPDGNTIAFVRSDQAAGSRIWTMPATGGAETPRTTYNDKAWAPSWSPDGSTLLFWHDKENVEGLYTRDMASGTTTLLRALDDILAGSYAWSPDGTQIVFTSRVTGQKPEVWVMDADGTDAGQVSPAGDDVNHSSVSWSNDLTPPTALPIQTVGVAMTPYQLGFGPGGSASFELTAGTLPPGLEMSPAGELTGTPHEWGEWRFEVTASNLSESEQIVYAMRVRDGDAPVAYVIQPGARTTTSHPVGLATSQPLRISWSDPTSGVKSFDLRFRRATWSGSLGAWQYPSAWQRSTDRTLAHTVSKGATYCYSARATDRSGRTGTWGSQRCLIAPLDDTSLARSSGWHKVTGTNYGGSAVQSSTKGATLTRTGARLTRVGIVTTTCPTCGTVEILVGTRVIGRISLARGTATYNLKPILLPRFSARTGTVRVRVVTSGKRVRIDGLIIGAR